MIPVTVYAVVEAFSDGILPVTPVVFSVIFLLFCTPFSVPPLIATVVVPSYGLSVAVAPVMVNSFLSMVKSTLVLPTYSFLGSEMATTRR